MQGHAVKWTGLGATVLYGPQDEIRSFRAMLERGSHGHYSRRRSSAGTADWPELPTSTTFRRQATATMTQVMPVSIES